MGSGTFAGTLLSLYTTRQRAVEIEGDLIEEREYRGGSWVQTGNMIYRLNREHGLHKLSSWQGGTTYAVERDLCDEPATTIYQ